MKKIITLIALCAPLMGFSGVGREVQCRINQLLVDDTRPDITEKKKIENRAQRVAFYECIMMLSEHDCY